jgi:hypothetical protein
LQRRFTQLRQRRSVRVAFEQSVMWGERLLDLGVLGQDGDVRGTEPFRRFALCQPEIINSLFGH